MNSVFKQYATSPAPYNFNGEDVIGDQLYQNNRQQHVNQAPQHIQVKAQQQYQDPNLYEDPNLEEINIDHPISIEKSGVVQSTTVTKNVVINLVVNLKINAI